MPVEIDSEKAPKVLKCGCGGCKVKVVGPRMGHVQTQTPVFACRCRDSKRCLHCGRCRAHNRCHRFVEDV